MRVRSHENLEMKNAFAIALSVAVGAGSMVATDEANAMLIRSYVEYVERYEGNDTVQLQPF